MPGKPQIITGGVWGSFFRFLDKYCGLSFLNGYPKFTKEVEFEHGFKIGSTVVTESMMMTLRDLVSDTDPDEKPRDRKKTK